MCCAAPRSIGVSRLHTQTFRDELQRTISVDYTDPAVEKSAVMIQVLAHVMVHGSHGVHAVRVRVRVHCARTCLLSWHCCTCESWRRHDHNHEWPGGANPVLQADACAWCSVVMAVGDGDGGGAAPARYGLCLCRAKPRLRAWRHSPRTDGQAHDPMRVCIPQAQYRGAKARRESLELRKDKEAASRQAALDQAAHHAERNTARENKLAEEARMKALRDL